MRKPFLPRRICFVLLLCLLNFSPAAQPSDEQVKLELEQLITELDKNQDASFWNERFEKIIEGITAFFKRFGRFIFFLLAGGFLIFLFFMLRALFSSFRRDPAVRSGKRREKAVEQKNATGSAGEGFYQQALVYAEKGEYGKAVVFLHRASVARLLGQHILEQDVEYTNNEIFSLLNGDSPLANSFSRLSRAAERVLFREDPLTAGEFHSLEEEYLRDFAGRVA